MPLMPLVFQVPWLETYSKSMLSLRAFCSSMKIKISGRVCKPGTRPSGRTSSIMKISLFAAFKPSFMIEWKLLNFVPCTKAPLFR